VLPSANIEAGNQQIDILKEYYKRRNPFYFLEDLHKTLVDLESEAKNVLLLYERDVNMPEMPREVPYETPFMTYLKQKILSEYGLTPEDVEKYLRLSSNPGNPSLEVENPKLAVMRRFIREAVERAKGEQISYLFSLERYRLERMRVTGWSVIKNAYYVMDWASRVVETASAASSIIQSFSDELDLPEGFTSDLTKLASLAMDVVGFVQRGIGATEVWDYRAQSKEQTGVVTKVFVNNKTKFVMLGDPLYKVRSGEKAKKLSEVKKGSGLTVKFLPVNGERDSERWRVPIWGVLAVFIDELSTIEWDDKNKRGDIIMFLYTARSQVLTSNFDNAFYECWNHIKMIIKKVSLAMELLQTKQKIIAQFMKGAPVPEQPPEIEGLPSSELPEGGEE